MASSELYKALEIRLFDALRRLDYPVPRSSEPLYTAFLKIADALEDLADKYEVKVSDR